MTIFVTTHNKQMILEDIGAQEYANIVGAELVKRSDNTYYGWIPNIFFSFTIREVEY
jgi:hypothetical protein